MDALHHELKPGPPAPGWWEDAFRRTATTSERMGKARGKRAMLIIIAYDIADPKRLKKVADCCKDFGVRVQLSVFECHLEADQLNRFWEKVKGLIDPAEDRVVAYPVPAGEARKIRTCGIMVCSEVAVSYIY